MNCAVLESAYEVKKDQGGMDEVIVPNGRIFVSYYREWDFSH